MLRMLAEIAATAAAAVVRTADAMSVWELALLTISKAK